MQMREASYDVLSGARNVNAKSPAQSFFGKYRFIYYCHIKFRAGKRACQIFICIASFSDAKLHTLLQAHLQYQREFWIIYWRGKMTPRFFLFLYTLTGHAAEVLPVEKVTAKPENLRAAQ
jgi:hypothetical protein